MDKKQLEEWLRKNDQLEIIPDAYDGETAVRKTPKARAVAEISDIEDGWTETERRFAREILQPMLETGEILWYAPQLAIYMPGQRYTVDFVAGLPDGSVHYYEVKGSKKLLGEARQSVMIRWLVEYLEGSKPDAHKVFKCDWRSKRGGELKWHIRRVKLRHPKHPIVRD